VLNDAIGATLPAAVAVALSPIPIVAVVLMVSTPRARTNGPAFAVGWVLGLSAVMAVVLLVFGGTASGSTTQTSVAWGTLALGVMLLALGIRQWQKRPRRGEDAPLPAWTDAVDAFSPGKSFVTGLLLSGVNPKNFALTAAAAGAIAVQRLSDTDEVWAAAVFVAIGSASVVGIVFAALVASERTAAPLASVRDYMTTHNAVIMTVILVLLGAKLIGDALPGL
jgi:threonine/homoserine/homoserine lactone efflux protein